MTSGTPAQVVVTRYRADDLFGHKKVVLAEQHDAAIAALTAELQQCREALEAALPHLIAHHTDPGAYKAARMVERAIEFASSNQEGRPSERGDCNLAGRVPQPLQASPSAPAAPAARAALKERT